MHRLLTCLALLAFSLPMEAQPPIAAPKAKAKAKAKNGNPAASAMTSVPVRREERVYKTTPQGELKLHMAFPTDWKAGDQRPAIVFFFGGGWKSGSFKQFAAHTDYFAARGMVAASADYRIASLHHTTPDKCVEDAKSAVRYLRSHAAELGIAPDKIVASGGSAGGHIAACTALVEAFDAESDDKSVSAKPNAMVLFNPALNIDELATQRVASIDDQAKAEAITPNRFIQASTPPAIMFFGTEDALKAGATDYLAKAKPLGLRAELWLAKGQAHGFFNRAPWHLITTHKADDFLVSLGFLTGPSPLVLPADASPLTREP